MILRPYQQEAIDEVLRAYAAGKKAPVIVAATGCHAAGQGVLMFDGSIKLVEDVVVGDLLMGPDGDPRSVLSLCRGTDEMVRITPTKGADMVVNMDHILTLVRTNDGGPLANKTTDISVREYLQQHKTYKHIHKLFRVPVSFDSWFFEDRPIDPYFMGVLLGDGSMARSIGVTKPDQEIRDEVHRQAVIWGLKVRFDGDEGDSNCTLYLSGERGRRDTNGLISALKSLSLHGRKSHDKFVPRTYLVAPRSARLAVLAGLLDTDGSLSHSGYDFISKSQQLSEDTCYLARSLGLAAYILECEKGCQTGTVGTYWRVSVSGDTQIIPCRIARKAAPARQQIKDALRTGFKITPEGIGDYYGFTLSGDGRYLLDDFTVTHNSGKSVLAGNIINRTVAKGKRAIVMAHRTELIEQLYEKVRAAGVHCGVIKGGDRRTDNSARVQVASVQTLVNRLKAGYKPPADLIVIDECHHVRLGNTYDKILKAYPDAFYCGLTATPERSDSAGLDDIFDHMILVSSPAELMADGFLCGYEIYESPNKLDFSGVKKMMGEYNEQQVATIVDKPKVIGDVYAQWAKHCYGKPTLVFARNRQHGEHLRDVFVDNGVKCVYVDDKTSSHDRAQAIQDYKDRRVTVLVNIGLFTEGTDLPLTECIQMTWPTLSLIKYLQVVGRGLRPSPGKSLATILDHGGNVRMHGLPDDPREWSLEGRKKKPLVKIPSVTSCPMCFALFRARTRECPRCGFQVIATGDPIPDFVDVELVKRETPTPAQRRDSAAAETAMERATLDSLMAERAAGGHGHKWPLVQFKNKFGKFPREKHGVKINYRLVAGKYEIVDWKLDGRLVAAPPPKIRILTDEELFA